MEPFYIMSAFTFDTSGFNIVVFELLLTISRESTQKPFKPQICQCLAFNFSLSDVISQGVTAG